MRKRIVLPLLFCLALLITVPAGVHAGVFNDVPDGSWYAGAVHYCYDKGYLYGTGENTFEPDTTMNRAMLVTVLYRFAGSPEIAPETAPSVLFDITGGEVPDEELTEPGAPIDGDGEVPDGELTEPGAPIDGGEEAEEEQVFPDVPNGTWYTDAVKWGVAEKVVSGYDDGTFRPTRGVSRQEMMAFFQRFLNYLGKTGGSADDRIFRSFPDNGSVGGWAKDAVVFCTSAGLICGSNGSLLPQDSSSRAQVASILLRLDSFIAGEMCTVSASAGSGGSVEPAGTFSIVKNSAIQFRFVPNDGYLVDAVYQNGASVGAVPSLSVSTANGNQQVSATFRYRPGNAYAGVAQLVNRTYPIANAKSYVPPNLTSIKYNTPGKDVKMQYEAAKALDQMIAAFRAAYPSRRLYGQSGYRSYSYQTTLYNNQISRRGGNIYRAGTISAIPGTSEHQMGLAIDVSGDGSLSQSFGSTTQGKWLAAHCHEYGFILRYPAGKEMVTGIIYEPWHFRYVGKDVAAEMKRTGVTTLEEYYGLYLADEDITPYAPYLK
ncbi:MAG: D-alanyl-D-alanine carboxypeptidase family protein [Bacillota bacterium]|jgi:LAS superfamily LD-carboxypeptidase LdcB